MKRSASSVLLLVALFMLSGCSAEDGALTQIVVSVDSDFEVPSELSTLEVTIGGKGSGKPSDADLSKKGFPRTLTLVHDGGPEGPILITARGLLNGKEIVSQAAQVSFRRGATVKVDLYLGRDCLNVACNANNTCTQGMCKPVEWYVPGEGFVEPTDGGDDGGTNNGQSSGGGTGSTGGANTAGSTGDAGSTGSMNGSTPTCMITLPVAGDAYERDTDIPLSGSCSDPSGNSISSGLRWRDDGAVLGTDLSSTKLTGPQGMAPHILTLCATYQGREGCSPGVRIDISSWAQPTVKISNPPNDTSFNAPQNTPFDMTGMATGAGVKLRWTDNFTGELSTTENASFVPNLIGRHTIHLQATDRNGRSVTDRRFLTVLPEGQAALVRLHPSSFPNIVGLASDLENEAVTHAYAWTSDGKVYHINAAAPTVALVEILQGSDHPPGLVRGIAFDKWSTPNKAYLATDHGLYVCGYSASEALGITTPCLTYDRNTNGQNNLPSDDILSVTAIKGFSDGEYYVLLGTVDGMQRLDVRAAQLLSGPTMDNLDGVKIRDIAADDDYHHAWLATDQGLYRYSLPRPSDSDRRGRAFKESTNGQPGSDMRTAAISYVNKVWVGAVASSGGLGGFGQFDETGWVRYRSSSALEDLVNNNVNVLAFERTLLPNTSAKRDVLWVGTDGGVSRFDLTVNDGFMNLTMADGLPANKILDALWLPASDTKLFATSGGLAVYTGP